MSIACTYTCHKCEAEFPSRTAANKHYNDKWHQYNLMRILKDLSPISEVTYNNLMKKSSFLEEAKNRVHTISCVSCKKNFTSQGSFETHQRSRKHKQNLVRKAAEKIRRLKIQKLKQSQCKAVTVLSVAKTSSNKEKEDSTEAEPVPEQGTQYCTACKAAFASEKDFRNHAQTEKHKNFLKAARLAEERKKELDRQDELHTTQEGDEDMEVEEVDSDEWEDDDNAVVESLKDDTKPLPLSVCLFCGKRSANLTDNLGHMERQHSFIVPHQEAGDLEQLQQYLGEKVGALHKCLECSKQFLSLRACRLHMLDKPHLSIRFEGEYDQFFDVSKILADIQLPRNPADNDIFAFPLPDGTMLTHRDLRRYFKQRLSLQPTAFGLKRLQGASALRAIGGPSHLGKVTAGAKTVAEVRKENERRSRALKTQVRKSDRKTLDVAVKANKLQKHFRHQVINAG